MQDTTLHILTAIGFSSPGTQNLHDEAVDAVEALPKIAAPD
jgi:hypothetical protein